MADNPDLGVKLTYFIKKSVKTLKSKRQEKEKESASISYPTKKQIRNEKNEIKPYLIISINDSNGKPVRRITKPYSKGIHRINWDGKVYRKDNPSRGAYFANAGDYYYQIIGYKEGSFDTLLTSKKFSLNHLNNLTLPALDDELINFQALSNSTLRDFDKFQMSLDETIDLAKKLGKALKATPEASLKDLEELNYQEDLLREIVIEINGDADISAKEFEVLPGLGERLSIATWGSFSMRSKPTSTMKEQIRIVREALPRLEKKLEEILYAIEKIETRNEAFGIPYVRGFED